MGICRDCPIFEYPLLSHGMGKATNFKFCTHIVKPIIRIHRNKSPLQISGKVADSGTVENFQGTHVLGASRGHLCDSSAVLFLSCQAVCG